MQKTNSLKTFRPVFFLQFSHFLLTGDQQLNHIVVVTVVVVVVVVVVAVVVVARLTCSACFELADVRTHDLKIQQLFFK
jgi:hypothetical protein